ncbi:MAG: DUF4333 domain-containing protein, partial [Actinomycetota bacterium]|nr:DUF4333 domain-containing protein [Actinomycetota bacterium]
MGGERHENEGRADQAGPRTGRAHPLMTRSLVAIGATVTALAGGGLVGCGGQSAGATIDAARLNDQISTGLAKQVGIPAPQVRCPQGQANRQGRTFRCSTTVDGQALVITAAVSDTQGNVRWQPSDALVSTPRAVTAIERQFTTQLHSSVTADCGHHAVTVVAVGASITCGAAVNGTARQVTVTARDLAGNVDLSLAPPANGPQSTTPPVTAAPTPGSAPGPPA